MHDLNIPNYYKAETQARFIMKERESILRISFILLLLNALLFTQIASAVDQDTKLKSALLKAIKTHDTATVMSLANGGYEAIDRDDVLQEKIYEYLDQERQRDIQAKEKAKADAIAKQEAEEKAKIDAIAAQKAAEEKAKADAIAKQKADAAAAAAAVAATKAAEEKKKQEAAAKKAAEEKAKTDAIAKQKADAAAAAAAVAAKKAADEKKKQEAVAAKKAADAKVKADAAAKQKAEAAALAAKKEADKKKAAAKKVTPAPAVTTAPPAPKAVPKAVIAAPVAAAAIAADDEEEDDDTEEMNEERADTAAVAAQEEESEPEPITDSDKKLLGTWKQISSAKVITLNVEENRNFSLEQIEDDGTLTIIGTWKSEENIFMLSIKKVQRNVHTRETDIHRIYKIQRLSAHRLVLLDKRNRVAYDLKR